MNLPNPTPPLPLRLKSVKCDKSFLSMLHYTIDITITKNALFPSLYWNTKITLDEFYQMFLLL